jgi:hypothetical protein
MMQITWAILWTSITAVVSTSGDNKIKKSLSIATTSNSNPSSVSATDSNTSIQQSKDGIVAAASLREQKNQDPYVKASPLSVAAVCSDGVALISLHYGVDDDCQGFSEDEETLKIANSVIPGANKEALAILKSNENDDGTGSQIKPTKHLLLELFRDLPMSTRGPLRIEQVYNHQYQAQKIQGISTSLPPTMALLTAGWRTDGMTLANAARELIAEEKMLYCLPYLAMYHEVNRGGLPIADEHEGTKRIAENASFDNYHSAQPMTTTQSYYGRRLAEGLSYYMAKCEFSESARSLSTVGLLAVGSNNIDGVGSIFLLDATGAYRVRAHSVGAGALLLNQKMGFVDFRSMNCREGLRVLLRMMADEGGLSAKPEKVTEAANAKGQQILKDAVEKAAVDTTSRKEYSEPQPWSLPLSTATELAIIKNGEGMMKRVRLATLFE